jgi:uncharacterized membrane protein
MPDTVRVKQTQPKDARWGQTQTVLVGLWIIGGVVHDYFIREAAGFWGQWTLIVMGLAALWLLADIRKILHGGIAVD